MATLASLLVVMGMDTKGLTAGTAKAEGSLAGLGASTSKFGSIADKAFLGLGVAAVAGVAIAIKAGSDLNEQLNRTGEVFEGSAQKVIAFSETTASSLGIAQSAALEAASNFGQLLEAAGFTETAMASMSTQLVTLAADLGSFNNIPVAEALEKIRAGLAGQARPLREVGVFLSEARVEAEAYSTGIAKVGAELTDAQKIQARYNIIMKDTAKAQGDFQRTLGESLPNQLKVLKAELIDVAANLGKALLPIVLEVVRAVKLVVPLVKLAADHFALLASVLAGYAAFRFLPRLLIALGGAIEVVAGTHVAVALISAGEAITALGVALATAAPLAVAFTAALVGLTAALVAWDPLGLVDDQKDWNAEMEAGTQHLNKFTSQTLLGKGPLDALGRAAHGAGMETSELGVKQLEAGRASLHMRLQMEAVADGAVQMGRKLSRVGKDIRDGIVDEIPGIIGSVTRVKDAFDISPKELQAIAHHWATIAHTIASDLRQIARSDLSPAMREAISALPPEMRDAWVRGNAQQRANIVQSIKETYKVQDSIPALARQALTGGHAIGMAMDQGITQGIESGVGRITSAAAAAVQSGLAAARRAADARSPSKKMEELGSDMIDGLVQGMLKNQNKLLDAAEKVMSSLQDKLGNLVSKAQSFGQGISGGFSSLLGFPTELPEGGDIGSFFQQQLGQAQRFADVLKALQAQGAGKGLLGEIASQGVAGIPMAQQLLQGGPEAVAAVNAAYNDIAKIAEKTADSLTNVFFGDRIDALRKDVKDQKDVLVDIKHNVKFLEKISNQLGDGAQHITVNINGDVTGEEIVRKVRDGLLKVGNRNAGTGL